MNAYPLRHTETTSIYENLMQHFSNHMSCVRLRTVQSVITEILPRTWKKKQKKERKLEFSILKIFTKLLRFENFNIFRLN